MVVDYEAAWVRLADFVAGRHQHGRDGLLREMAVIAAECRVPAGDLSRLLRLHGVEVERARSIAAETDPDELEAFVGGQDSPGDGGLSGHHSTEVDDGSRNAELAGSGSGNGRG